MVSIKHYRFLKVNFYLLWFLCVPYGINSLSVYADPKEHFTFQKIFAAVENKQILLAFLNEAVLTKSNQKCSDLTYLPSHLPKELYGGQSSEVDILCQNEKTGDELLVEMHLKEADGFLNRGKYYSAMNKSEWVDGPDKTRGVTTVCICDYNVLPTNKDFSVAYNFQEVGGSSSMPVFTYILIQLKRFTITGVEDAKTNQQKWLFFLRYANKLSKVQAESLSTGNPQLKAAFRVANTEKWDPADMEMFERLLYAKRLRDKEDRALERSARIDERRSIARMLLDRKSLPIEEISKVTGLDRKIIEDMAKKFKKT